MNKLKFLIISITLILAFIIGDNVLACGMANGKTYNVCGSAGWSRLTASSSGVCGTDIWGNNWGSAINFRAPGGSGNYEWECTNCRGCHCMGYVSCTVQGRCLATCNQWSACRPNNTKTCLSSTPLPVDPEVGCWGTPVVYDEWCQYSSPCSYSCGGWSGCSGSSHTEYQTCTANNQPCTGNASYTNSRGCTPSCQYSCYWSGCSGSSHSESNICNATNSPCNGSASYVASTRYCTPACQWSCTSYGSCYQSGSQWIRTRTCSQTNAPCSGGSPATTEVCAPVNGVCGSSDKAALETKPTANFCSQGTASTVGGTGPWTWTCSSQYGGTVPTCTAHLKGVCGSANGVGTYSAPVTGLCSLGNNSAIVVTGNDFTWSCNGSNSSANTDDSLCSAPIKKDALCGSAAGGSSVDAPSTGLCNQGNPGPVSASGTTFSWTCTGINGGNNKTCSSIKVPPACGSADGQSFVDAPDTGLCAYGSPGSPEWLDNSYSRRKAINITNTSGVPLSDYQIKLSIAYDSDMQADFDDLRFTSSDKMTKLRYWIESKTDSSSAVVWVRVPTISALGTTIYMYYGNSVASNESNGENTFILFDHFNTLDNAKWETVSLRGSLSNASSNLQINLTSPYSGAGVVSRSKLPSDVILETRMQRATAADAGEIGLLVGVTNKASKDNTYYGNYNSCGSNLYSYTSLGYRLYTSDGAYGSSGNASFIGQWARVTTKISYSTKKTNSIFTYAGNTYSLSGNTGTPLANPYLQIFYGEYQRSGLYGYVDWVAARTYSASEPLPVVGIEQSNTASLSGLGPWSWYCVGGGTVSPKCTATQIPPVCGPANGQSFVTAPTTGLCTQGNPRGLDWFDNSYSRRKPLVITSASALSDYQVKMTVAYDSDMQANFDDLRFTSSDGKTVLAYWIESKNPSSAVVWVKVPSIATIGTTIYMYYGNPSATTTSNFNIFTPITNWGAVTWRKFETSNCSGPSGWVSASFNDSGWTAQTNPNFMWACDSCDIYSRTKFMLPSARTGTFTITTDDRQQVFINGSTLYDGGCRVSATETRGHTASFVAGENIIALHGAEVGGGEYLGMSSVNISGAATRTYSGIEPTVSFGAEALSSANLTGTGPWEWYCVGSGGISSPKCIATQIPPACGSSNGQSFPVAPTTDLCAYGNPGGMDWLDNSYTKRKPLTITSASTLSDYQVKMTVTYDADMRVDFGDLRFTSSDGKTLLNYWVESKTNSSSAIVWVKIPSIVASGTKIYMYYGNPSATTTSNFNIFTPITNWGAVTWRKFETSNCSGPSGWVSASFNDSGWTAQTNPNFMWACNQCDIYSRTKFMLPSATTGTFTITTDDRQQVFINGSTLYDGGCRVSATETRGHTASFVAGENVIALHGAEYAGGEFLGISSVNIPGAATRAYSVTEPTVSFGAETVDSANLSGAGPWEWYCIGAGGTSSPKCTAFKGVSSLSANNFKDPFDFAAEATSSREVKEQCVWCEYYYSSITAESTVAGKRGAGLSFGFTYRDQPGRKLSSYEYIITSENVTDPESAAAKIRGSVSGLLTNPGSPVVLSDFSMMTNALTGTSSLKRIPYDGKNYYLWIKMTNDSGQVSEWIRSDNPFEATNHKWPKVSIVANPIVVNVPTQFCSTALPLANGVKDPCLDLCWVKSSAINGVTNIDFNFSDRSKTSQQLESSSWKCSVCYDSSGQAILCQDTPKEVGQQSNFDWEIVDLGASVPPTIPTFSPSNMPTWWKYGPSQMNNNRASNPVVQFRQSPTDKAKAKLRIYGSECPLQAGVNSKTIRPIWIE